MTSIETRWSELWDKQLAGELEDERSGNYQPEEFYVSGRKSKDWPEKENPAWWLEKGPGFVKAWTIWRDNCGLDIWTAPDGQPGIELKVEAERGDTSILCYIDRVMVDSAGDLYIVDLKTGSQTPAWPQQLAFNNLALGYTYGVQARYGGFWSPRKGGIVGGLDGAPWADLRLYDDEWLWNQADMAKAIRDQQLFLAHPNNLCTSACGVRPYCKAMGGELSITLEVQHDTGRK